METYQRTIFAIVRGSFVVVPIFSLLILLASAFDHPLGGNEIGAAIFIIGIAVAGFLFTGLIRRIIMGE